MEEASAPGDSYIEDGMYLEDSVREDVRWQTEGMQPNQQNELRMDQKEGTHQEEISEIFNCDTSGDGVEEPFLDFNTSCTQIVERNP